MSAYFCQKHQRDYSRLNVPCPDKKPGCGVAHSLIACRECSYEADAKVFWMMYPGLKEAERKDIGKALSFLRLEHLFETVLRTRPSE